MARQWKCLMKNPFYNRLQEDLKFGDLMNASAVKTEQFKPTELSLQDTVSCVERKYGKDWRNFQEAKCIVIWASTIFLDDHVQEIVPDLYDFCIEYKTKKTINGHQLSDDFFMLPFSLFEPSPEE